MVTWPTVGIAIDGPTGIVSSIEVPLVSGYFGNGVWNDSAATILLPQQAIQSSIGTLVRRVAVDIVVFVAMHYGEKYLNEFDDWMEKMREEERKRRAEEAEDRKQQAEEKRRIAAAIKAALEERDTTRLLTEMRERSVREPVNFRDVHRENEAGERYDHEQKSGTRNV